MQSGTGLPQALKKPSVLDMDIELLDSWKNTHAHLAPTSMKKEMSDSPITWPTRTTSTATKLRIRKGKFVFWYVTLPATCYLCPVLLMMHLSHLWAVRCLFPMCCSLQELPRAVCNLVWVDRGAPLKGFSLNYTHLLLFLAFISSFPPMSLHVLHSVFLTTPWLYIRKERRESSRSALLSAEIKSEKSVKLPDIIYDLGLKLRKGGREELGENKTEIPSVSTGQRTPQCHPHGTLSLRTMTLE